MHGCRSALIRWVAATVLLVLAVPATAAATTYTVLSPNDGGGSCRDGECDTLRAALATATDGDTIHLPASEAPYNQQQGAFVVRAGVRIVGDGAGETIVT